MVPRCETERLVDTGSIRFTEPALLTRINAVRISAAFFGTDTLACVARLTLRTRGAGVSGPAAEVLAVPLATARSVTTPVAVLRRAGLAGRVALPRIARLARRAGNARHPSAAAEILGAPILACRAVTAAATSVGIADLACRLADARVARLTRRTGDAVHAIPPTEVLAISLVAGAAITAAATVDRRTGRRRGWRRRRAVSAAAVVLRYTGPITEPLIAATSA